jgi:hypothetical protein
MNKGDPAKRSTSSGFQQVPLYRRCCVYFLLREERTEGSSFITTELAGFEHPSLEHANLKLTRWQLRTTMSENTTSSPFAIHFDILERK